MKPALLSLFASLFVVPTLSAQGLRFRGSEEPIDNRTSYDVLGERRVRVADSFDISFDMSLYPETKIGYILRIKGGENIYNMFFDGQGEGLVFSFNEEGRSSLIVAQTDRAEMQEMRWTGVELRFDLVSDAVTLKIGERVFTARDVGLPEKYAPSVVFGRSDHIIDVPSFAIKDLSVEGDAKRYDFPLSESSGEAVHDAAGREIGVATNPEWMIDDSFHWRLAERFRSKSVAGAVYDPARQRALYFNRDTLYTYDVLSGDRSVRPFRDPCPVGLKLGTSFLAGGQLWVYEVFSETQAANPSANSATSPAWPPASVASLDLETLEWRVESRDRLPTQLHHHSAWMDAQKGRYTIFGGFGNMRFSGDFHSLDVSTGEWETHPQPDGDVIWPRYFSSMGGGGIAGAEGLYVFGGMGNESGEQIVGRKYFYDLHRVDLNGGRSTKLWEIEWDGNNVVPVRSMVIPDGEHFYTLCYPEHFSDSALQLYRFSIADGSCEILGDRIPIHSDRITTNANLCYDEPSGRLYALVQEFGDDDVANSLAIYSLTFPPLTAEQLADFPGGKKGRALQVILVACAVAAVAAAVAFSLRRRPNRPGEAAVDDPNPEKPVRPNSVYLFGDFTVRDRGGRDISYMFSSRLRQTFCLILGYGEGEGISSHRLSEILWPDRPEDKVKNTRGVTINHLRKVLGELDDVELVYSGGSFRIVCGERFYCDCVRLTEMIAAKTVGKNRREFLDIVSRGKFLRGSGGSSFDPFKTKIEHLLEPVLLVELEKSFEAEEYRTTLALADSLFAIDPLSDEALSFQIRALRRLKMHDEAQHRYQAFALEYKKNMGADYPRPL